MLRAELILIVVVRSAEYGREESERKIASGVERFHPPQRKE
jgi:hypothetical protein